MDGLQAVEQHQEEADIEHVVDQHDGQGHLGGEGQDVLEVDGDEGAGPHPEDGRETHDGHVAAHQGQLGQAGLARQQVAGRTVDEEVLALDLPDEDDAADDGAEVEVAAAAPDVDDEEELHGGLELALGLGETHGEALDGRRVQEDGRDLHGEETDGVEDCGVLEEERGVEEEGTDATDRNPPGQGNQPALLAEAPLQDISHQGDHRQVDEEVTRAGQEEVSLAGELLPHPHIGVDVPSRGQEAEDEHVEEVAPVEGLLGNQPHLDDIHWTGGKSVVSSLTNLNGLILEVNFLLTASSRNIKTVCACLLSYDINFPKFSVNFDQVIGGLFFQTTCVCLHI